MSQARRKLNKATRRQAFRSKLCFESQLQTLIVPALTARDLIMSAHITHNPLSTHTQEWFQKPINHTHKPV